MLEEIEEERRRLKIEKEIEGPSTIAGDEEEDAVLVACKDERMCQQLQDVVRHGPQKVNPTVLLLRPLPYPLLYQRRLSVLFQFHDLRNSLSASYKYSFAPLKLRS